MIDKEEEFYIRATVRLSVAGFTADDIVKIWTAVHDATALEDAEAVIPRESTPDIEYYWDGDVDEPWVYVVTDDHVARWTEDFGWTPRISLTPEYTRMNYPKAPDNVVGRIGSIPEGLLS